VDHIVRSLFPADIADRLTQSRFARLVPRPVQESSAADPATGSLPLSLEAPLHNPLELSAIHKEQSIIADSIKSASIICVSFNGIENIRPCDVQLEVLSQLFIAAERVASTRDAIKVKSIGTEVLFVCGIQKSDTSHSENACNLAIDLQRMLMGFQKERSLNCLSLRVGIAMGPVVAGVIGIARPKYDIWGYTVSVAEKLCQVATSDQLLVTRDVAKSEQTRFKFKVVKQFAIVQGIGKIMPFALVPPANLVPIPPKFVFLKPRLFPYRPFCGTTLLIRATAQLHADRVCITQDERAVAW